MEFFSDLRLMSDPLTFLVGLTDSYPHDGQLLSELTDKKLLSKNCMTRKGMTRRLLKL
jgi:hypothetical protein